MSSGELETRLRRVDDAHDGLTAQSRIPESDTSGTSGVNLERLKRAVGRTRDYLLQQQRDAGFWVAELEGDTILESEYILLLEYLRRDRGDRQVNAERIRRAANYIREQQLPGGGWALYPGGPPEISASVKAYFALKLAGHEMDAEYMLRAKRAILQAGGAERVNSFTRYYLALLGVISYEQCPAVPPELILVPSWLPLNVYEMSAWSRTIVVPLSLLWAYRPGIELPEEFGIRELFVNSPEALPMTMGPSEALDEMQRPTWIDWERLFRRLDGALKLAERWGLRPLRKAAIRRAADWMLKRFAESDGLGAIFPPIVWSIVALRCLGYDDDSTEVQTALCELDKLIISEGDTDRLQPCKSPVWDTAIATIALREAGVAPEHPAIRSAQQWLLSKEVRQPGDWSVLNTQCEPSGWFFEFNNAFYPDVDDTSMVVMALRRCLPETCWRADHLLDEWSLPNDRNVTAPVSGRVDTVQAATSEVDSMQRLLGAIHRGARWALAMQCRDGGWGAFDADNDREILTRVPFADHNAMIDPGTADLTSRMLEMLAGLDVSIDHPAVQRALEFIWNSQEDDHCWYGRWGVNYIYGTWQCLVGLTEIGVSRHDVRLRAAAEWLKSKQQSCGGWGESPRSYDEPHLRGQGPPTASQTAWALMGLLAIGEVDSEAVRRGVCYLLETQREDGTWDEPWFTGTGFPRVFYLKYHYYPTYFPLMALARYQRLRSDSRPRTALAEHG